MTRLVCIALIVLAACQKKQEDPGPSCEQLTDHMLQVTRQSLLGHEAMSKNIRAQSIAQCEQRHLTKVTRVCMMAAKDTAGLVECYRKEPGAHLPPRPRPLPRPTIPPPAAGGSAAAGSGSAAPAPAPSGSGSGSAR